MTRTGILGSVIATGLLTSVAGAATLDDVQERGALRCGVTTGLAGFAAQDRNGMWQGFDVDFCRALAAAVLGDPQAVEFVPTDTTTRFDALEEGKVDVLARNTTWTFENDTGHGFDFAGISYYDGQGFMVPKEFGVTSAKELDDTRICVETSTTAALNLADFFRKNTLSYEPVAVATNEQAQQRYLSGECHAFTADTSALAATRATFETPTDHVILPEIISKEPLAPLVREGDDEWADVVRWTLNALIAAEEYGVTSANVADMAASAGGSPEVNRLLGTEGEFGETLGLPSDWAVRAILAGGNYGEIFERNIGQNTPIGLARGLNAQWTEGGLLYAPPFR